MKSLKEALLNRPKNIDVARMVAEEYINANYNIKGKLSFENVNGVCVVNCDGDVKVKNLKIEKLTDGFKLGEVKGNFQCSYCAKLKSLEDAPEKVRGNFSCCGCTNLESLEGASKEFSGSFYCYDCKNLKTLKGSPEDVDAFYCSYCSSLTSLEGAPKEVGEVFICFGCKNLKSLEGAPKKVRKIDCDSRLK